MGAATATDGVGRLDGTTPAPYLSPDITEFELRPALDAMVRDSLRPIAAVLSALFAVFAVSHALLLPKAVVLPMVVMASSSAIVLFGISLASRKWLLPAHWAHPIGAGVAGLVLLNGLFHMYMLSEPQQSTNVALVIIGAGCFLLSTRWLALVIVIALGGWGLTAWALGGSPAWVHFGFMQVGATAIAVLVHSVRLRTTQRLLRLHIQDERRQTELKDAVEALRDSQSRYRELFENANDIVFTIDLAGNFTSVNKAAEQATGYTRDEVPPINFAQVLAPEYRSLAHQMLERKLVEGGTTSYALEIVSKDGRRLPLEVSTRLIYQDGKPVGVQGIARDITERRKAEMEIRTINKELEQRVSERTADLMAVNAELMAVNKELESFSYSVSHDLRAPLRSIDGFSQMLLEDYAGKLDAGGKDCLQRVRAATQRMGQLIDELLKMSQVTRAEMRRTAVDLSRLAKMIAGELRDAQPERQVEFRITEGLVTKGDPVLLRVVLENVLGNSWKFTSRHARARIEFGILEDRSDAGSPDAPVYFVRDDGAGFDMAYAGNLFRPFHRLHQATEFEGTGIGLATVQRIIHRHGGRVWAEGEVERGATFYFTIREQPQRRHWGDDNSGGREKIGSGPADTAR